MEVKKIILNSLDKEKYPDIEIECEFIENIKGFTKQYLNYIENKGIYPKKAQKTAEVVAVLGELNQEVDTRPRIERDGKIYTIGETKGKITIEGSMIVKNPDGEEYIVKPNAFEKNMPRLTKKMFILLFLLQLNILFYQKIFALWLVGVN